MENLQNQGFNLKTFGANVNTLLARPNARAISGFKAKLPICIEKDQFVVKTASDEFELEQALRLRHQVFIVELLGKKRLFGIDIDKYDTMCDHLLVVDKGSEAVIATYRLNSDRYSDRFYSENEFELSGLFALPGVKLEIGRACVHREYRRGNVMGLLWEGIHAYLGALGAQYIFGCSSIMTTDLAEIALVHRFFKGAGYHRDDLGVEPVGKYRIGNLPEVMRSIASMNFTEVTAKAEKLVPRLVRDYFKFGARICGEPALDGSFKCADVLTLLDMSFLNHSYKEERFVK
mgnify:CR=1 FL=1